MPVSSASILILHQRRQESESRDFRQEILAAQETERRLKELRRRLQRAADLYRERMEGPRDRNRDR